MSDIKEGVVKENRLSAMAIVVPPLRIGYISAFLFHFFGGWNAGCSGSITLAVFAPICQTHCHILWSCDEPPGKCHQAVGCARGWRPV